MPYYVGWYLQPRVSLCAVWGQFTSDEMLQASVEVINLIQSSDVPIQHIVDMRYMETYPKNIRTIIQSTPFFREPNLAHVAFLSDNKFVQFLSSTASQVFRVKFAFFAEPEEAVNFFRRVDQTLPELPPYPQINEMTKTT